MWLEDTVREASFLTFYEDYIQRVVFDEVFNFIDWKLDGVCEWRFSFLVDGLVELRDDFLV